MTVTLVLSDHIAAELFDAAAADVETACVLLARHVETPGGNVRLLARALHWVPDDAYRRREATALSIASHGYVPALAAAEADGSVPIWLHTHPGNDSSPRPSKHDEIVDEQLAELFRLRAGSDLYGAIVIAQPEGRRCFTGHIESENRRTEIDRLWVTGRRFMLIQNWPTGRASRVATNPLFHTCRRHYPGGTGRCSRRSLPDRWQPSPLFRRVGFRVACFEACSAFNLVAARVVAEPPRAALCRRSASADVVASIVRSDCYRLERQLPGGIRTR